MKRNLSKYNYDTTKNKERMKQKRWLYLEKDFLIKVCVKIKKIFIHLKIMIILDDDYFFSYKDIQNKIYYFDIRSFNKLIKKSKNTPVNPYNREIIPEHIITI